MSVLLSGADVVDMAVQTEMRGERFYRQAAAQADSSEAKELFRYLADEELRHKKVFEGLGGNIVFTEVEGAGWQEAVAYIEAAVDTQFFAGGAAIRLIPERATTQEMIRQAIDFEQQTLLFFHTLRDLVQTPNRPLIDAIIAEERRHVVRLSRMLGGTG